MMAGGAFPNALRGQVGNRPYGREQVDLGELSKTELTHLNSFECIVGGEGVGWRNPTGADQLCLQAKSFWSPRKE